MERMGILPTLRTNTASKSFALLVCGSVCPCGFSNCLFFLCVFVCFRTPLMLAVLGGHTDCVRFLLEKGALPDAKDKRSSTALHRGVSLPAAVCPVVESRVVVGRRFSSVVPPHLLSTMKTTTIILLLPVCTSVDAFRLKDELRKYVSLIQVLLRI